MTTGLDGLHVPFTNPYDDEPEYLYSTMVFQQSFAPVGWSKRTDNNDCMLRIVSDLTSPGSGGNNSLSSTMFSVSLNGANIPVTGMTTNRYFTTVTDMPSHTHTFTYRGTIGSIAYASPSAYSPSGSYYPSTTGMNLVPITVGTAGTTLGHNHTLPTQNISVSSPISTVAFKFKYVDSIIATRYFRGPDTLLGN